MIKTIFQGILVIIFMHLAFISYLYTLVFNRADLVNKFFAWSNGYGRFVIKLTRTELVVEGEDNLEKISPDSPVIVVSNHESYLDIPAIMASVPFSLGFIAKKELGYFPILRFWIPAIGGVLLDRKNLRKSHETLQKMAESRGKRALLVFPEGTRNKKGTVALFKPGSLKIAFGRKGTIVPVTVVGGRQKFEGNRFRTRPGTVFVKFHEPVDTKTVNPLGRQSLAESLHKTVLESHRKLTARLQNRQV